MTIRRMTEILSIDNIATVHFHNDYSKGTFFSKVYDKENLEDLTSCKPEYGLYFPDETVEKAFEITKDINIIHVQINMENIQSLYDSHDESLAFSVYSILHEVGHWLDYNERSQEGRQKYICGFLRDFNNLQTYHNYLCKSNFSVDTINSKDATFYNDMGHEKTAIKYAKLHFGEAYQKIKVNF